MPDVGEGLTEAEILKWYVQPGDTVTDGQVVCEVETAKAAVELPIPYDGVVRELRFAEGTTVDVGYVDHRGGRAPGAVPRAGRGGGRRRPSPPSRSPRRRSRQGRQPVLVGYGVSASSTKRRPRKGAEVPAQEVAAAVQQELNGHSGRAEANGHGGPGALTGRPAPTVAGRASAGEAAGAQARQGSRRRPDDGDADGPRRRHHPRGRARGGRPGGPRAGAHGAGRPGPAPAAPAASYDGTRETRVPVKGVRKATARRWSARRSPRRTSRSS